MKKSFLTVFTSLLVFFSIAQEKIFNDVNAEARRIGSFHAIKVSHGIELIIKQGASEGVAISASEKEYRDRIKTEVVNGVLKIYYDNDKWWKNNNSNKKLKAYVSFLTIDKIEGNSGSMTKVEGSLTAANFALDLASGAEFKGHVKVHRMIVEQNSGSISKVSGQVESLIIETSSGAVFSGYDLATDRCDADASSGGSIQITVNKELTAEASTGAGIRYKGSGVITKISTSTGGLIRKNS
jgi:hypothetical protein